uniref:Transcriptional regulator n=1 Tax=Panagrellus redivivus TaxID=6233 RepID=A0A7E4VFP7_PANRE
MDAFRRHIDSVMRRQSAGRIVSIVRGQKADGQRFALVKTQVVWYAVRVIFEGSYAVEREEFMEESLADKYVEFKKRALEGGVF